MTQRHVISTVPERARHPFPTGYANVGMYPGFKFYFEAVILEANLMQIGVISPHCMPMAGSQSLGCGDDKYAIHCYFPLFYDKYICFVVSSRFLSFHLCPSACALVIPFYSSYSTYSILLKC
jgi:hypothetical protein